MAPSRVFTPCQRLSSKIRNSGTSRQIQSSFGLIRETPPPSRWILAIAQSIPDEAPYIELIAQYARPTERMAADRRPWPTAGTGDALTVEFGRDPARALARGKVRNDATNHCRLGLVDLFRSVCCHGTAPNLISQPVPNSGSTSNCEGHIPHPPHTLIWSMLSA